MNPAAAPATTTAGRLLVGDFRGGAFARGRRHGENFGERVIASGILDFYLRFCERQLLAEPSRPAGLAIRAAHFLVALRHSPEAAELIDGFSAGSRIPRAKIAQALVMPDVLNFLTGSYYRRAGLGCTSVAAWGDYTPDGRLRYARNLDFPGNGFFDRNPLLARHQPDKGLPYVSLGTAGTVVDGITGINAEGLSVAVHQHMSTDVGLLTGGRPILDLARQLLQHCRTLEEAAELCAGWRTTSAWSIVLTHWKSRRAWTVERSARRCAVVRYEAGKMARANDFTDPELRRLEADYPGFRDSSRLRARRADELLEEKRGRVDAAALANLLGDHWDPERKRSRAFAGAIAQPHNVSSVVFEPEEGIAWVSDGTAPVCEGPFRRVELWEDSEPGPELPGVENALAGMKFEASRRYLDAFGAWTRRKNADEALALLDRAVADDPDDPIYRHMHGVLALKCGNPGKALETLSAGAALPDNPHRRQAQRLWQARALDLLGRRAEAVSLYGAIAAETPITKPLRAAAEEGGALPYESSRLRAVVPDFIFGDVYRY